MNSLLTCWRGFAQENGQELIHLAKIGTIALLSRAREGPSE